MNNDIYVPNGFWIKPELNFPPFEIDNNLLITGGMSMLGWSLFENEDIRNRFGRYLHSPPKDNLNYLNLQDIVNFIINGKINHIIHLATYSGNLQFNQKNPANTFYLTSQMALNVLTAAQICRVKKVLSILSSCAVADKGEEELKEEDLHKGPPNPTIESHGYAKRILDIYSRQLNKQYGLNAVCAIVNNSFGPYDAFSPEKTKVVGAMIKRFVDAKEQNLPFVECWGTGIARREFIYCKDVARLLVLALEKYDDYSMPINIGSPDEVTIKELAETTAELVGYTGEIRWLKEKGDGQLRKKLNLDRMNKILLDNKPFEYTNFKVALKETIDWYQQNKDTWTK